jgi:hypothetical protein
MKDCPTCHRPFERTGRICYACDRPIKRHHKWHVKGSFIRHDDCANPELDAAVETPLLASQPDTQSLPLEGDQP